jgi:hypothetical protein
MKKINITKIVVVFLSVLLYSCSGEDDNYKTFTGPQEALFFNNTTSELEVTGAAATFIEVLVSSTTKSNVDRILPLSVSPFSVATPNQYSIDMSTAVIRAGENTAKVRVNSANFASLPVVGGRDLVLVMDADTYMLPGRSNHVVTIKRGCLDTRVNFNIAFDGYASEITWRVRNSANVIVASSSGYSDGLASYAEQFCLTPGNYTFVMDDSYGDGLSFPGNGSYTITLNGSNVVLLTGGGNFGFTTGVRSFTIN